MALRLAAHAGARVQAMFLLGHDARHAVAGQEHVAFIGLVRPAHRGRIGTRHPADLLHKALRQRLQPGCRGGQRADLVKRRQALVLHGNAGGLLAHLLLQAFVRDLQRLGHLVEPRGELAKFVIGLYRQPRPPLSLAQTRQRLLQLRHRIEHQQIAHCHEGDCSGNGHRHHGELKEMQHGGPARNLDFDGLDKAIHFVHKAVRLGQ